MIFNDLKAIFIHNERTGGVSVRKHLLQYEKHFERIASTKHLTCEETKKLVGNKWDDYLTFAFVRNPYDRLVSWFTVCNEHQEWISPVAKYMRKYKTLEELVLDNRPHEQILLSQYEKTKDVDWLFAYERYDGAMRSLCDMLKIPYKSRYDNSSYHAHYTTYYTKEMLDIVNEWFKKDLEMFNYNFGG